MKKNLIFSAFCAVMMIVASCQKTPVNNVEGVGYLSFADFALDIDEDVVTKASAASGNYSIFVLDADGNTVLSKTYAEVKDNQDKISIPAGNYTLVARSAAEDVPVAVFEQPVYGASESFSIAAGETETIGSLICTLLQCKVTVDYADAFLDLVTGSCSTKVELTAGYPLDFALNADGSYDRSAGYFAVNGNTMTVSFKGSIEGKTMTMTKVFTGIAPKQWRQIKFIPKVDEEGTATFDIVINDLIPDEELNQDVPAEEDIIGSDPNAPEDDGGIRLLLAEGCDETITYSEEDIVYDADGVQINSTGIINIPIRPLAEDGSVTMNIKFDAIIPDGLAELTVDIATDSESFAGAVATANAMRIDLVNPVCDPLIFDVVPFPHGDSILGLNEIAFDLSNAQKAIVAFPGTHVFTMTVVDANGKTKINKVTMLVE